KLRARETASALLLARKNSQPRRDAARDRGRVFRDPAQELAAQPARARGADEVQPRPGDALAFVRARVPGGRPRDLGRQERHGETIPRRQDDGIELLPGALAKTGGGHLEATDRPAHL